MDQQLVTGLRAIPHDVEGAETYKAGSVRVRVHRGTFAQLLLQWKNCKNWIL
jgi:hypothetical protein